MAIPPTFRSSLKQRHFAVILLLSVLCVGQLFFSGRKTGNPLEFQEKRTLSAQVQTQLGSIDRSFSNLEASVQAQVDDVINRTVTTLQTQAQILVEEAINRTITTLQAQAQAQLQDALIHDIKTNQAQNSQLNEESPAHEVSTIQANAKAGLEIMQQRKAMETAISERDFVLDNGFPIRWSSCTLHRVLRDKRIREQDSSSELNVVLVGGSASSRPAVNCNFTDTNNQAFAGRYSDYLQHQLNMDVSNLPPFRVYNRAQGFSYSTLNALILDNVMEKSQTDIIIWEFIINDTAGDSQDVRDQIQKLNFWLTRVKVHFEAAGRRPPPILLCYLWSVSTGYEFRGKKYIDEKPFEKFGPTIESYQKIGMDIELVNVGGAVNYTKTFSNRYALFDDMHHPACPGVHVIADMLQHAIYANLGGLDGSCTEEMLQAEQQWENHVAPATQDNLGSLKGPQYQELWNDLFQESTRIGSISGWEPRVSTNSSFSNLRLENPLISNSWERSRTGKADPGRQDRKYAYVIHPCNSEKRLHFRLLDPDLKWLGLSIGGKFSVVINNVTVGQMMDGPDWVTGISFTGFWINVWNQTEPILPKTDKAVNNGQPYYDLSICGQVGTMNHFVAATVTGRASYASS